MAGRNIKGITVEIGGDTTKLQTALEGVNSKIKSSQAGTAIRSGLTRLVKPTKQVREAMDKYGISIEGDPGDGKSSLILQVAARLTKGEAMPDGYQTTEPASVVYQCCEDDLADTVKPRSMAAGALCDKVAYIIDDDNSLTFSTSALLPSLPKPARGS